MDTALDRISSIHRRSDVALIDALHFEEDRLSREAVDEFLAGGERMIWRLTDLCRDEKSWTRTGSALWAPVHATYILGAFGDSRALMGLLASLRWSARYDVDWVYGKLPSILGRIGRPALLPLKARVADTDAGELDRLTELHALAAVAAHHPIHQGEVLDFLRSMADNSDEQESVRNVAASILLKFVRPGDQKSILASAIRQEWSDRPPLFDARDIDAAYARNEQQLDSYKQEWLDFYTPEAIEARQRRWAEEAEDLRWSQGVSENALWIGEQRHAFLTKYEFTLGDLDDEARGDALWVAESLAEYLVSHEGLAPWRCNRASVFSYLMDFFARRISLDDAGRIHAVPDNILRYARFCAGRGVVSAADLRDVEEVVEAEREDFVSAVVDADRRQTARAVLERMLAQGLDPRDPDAPPAAAVPATRERKTSRRLRIK
ncbi:MAG TPA: hypothetical protein VM222_05010 [Planctomycetota bacterium]|nr:hypothetical protein [Planctomycetota bacterium]